MASSPKEGRPVVSVIVVSYNTRDALRRCLNCIEEHHEVIVVDNASIDGSPEMVEFEFPAVKLIRNSKNRGFGAANNLGLGAATGDLALFLNSDCYANPGAIDRLSEALADNSVVAAGGRLLNPDHSLQQSAANALTLWAVFCEQTGIEKLFHNPYWVSHKFDQTHDVEQVMGACLMVRGTSDRFDERFFLYCEDTELCHRLRTRGKILYVPEAQFIHDLGTSSTGERWRSVARYNRGKELYFRIHHGAFAAFLCWAMNRMGAALRVIVFGLVGVFRASARAKAKTFWKVLWAPHNGPDAFYDSA